MGTNKKLPEIIKICIPSWFLNPTVNNFYRQTKKLKLLHHNLVSVPNSNVPVDIFSRSKELRIKFNNQNKTFGYHSVHSSHWIFFTMRSYCVFQGQQFYFDLSKCSKKCFKYFLKSVEATNPSSYTVNCFISLKKTDMMIVFYSLEVSE